MSKYKSYDEACSKVECLGVRDNEGDFDCEYEKAPFTCEECIINWHNTAGIINPETGKDVLE